MARAKQANSLTGLLYTLPVRCQLGRAYAGDPWHGSPLRVLLSDVTVAQGRARPLASAHTIWELVLHIDLFVRVALVATRGVAMPKLFGTENVWPPMEDDDSGWALATDRMFHGAEQLAQAIEAFTDRRLQKAVPGREYDVYYLFHGIVQHSLYHEGADRIVKEGTFRHSDAVALNRSIVNRELCGNRAVL